MRIPRRCLAAIQREYLDSDGYWIELMPGWQNGLDLGTHGIVEDNKLLAYTKLRYIVPCNCAECLALKRKDGD